MSDIKSILTKADAGERDKLIENYVNTAIEKADSAALKALLEKCVDDSIPLTSVRAALKFLLENITTLEVDIVKPLVQLAIDLYQPRATSFTEELVTLREILADAFSLEKSWKEAAKALNGIPLEACAKTATDEYKALHYTRIAEFHLEADDTVSAETYVNRAWPLIHAKMGDNIPLRFGACHARIHDAKRKFLDAAQKYYELSQLVPPDQQADCLRSATVCTILADAGSRRSRLLATLTKDERSQKLGPLYTVLEKVFHDRILRPKDVDEITPYLMPHHMATTSDGSTVLQRAVMQHNLFSASKLYYNITFTELGSLLGVTPEKAEKVAATMISAEQLRGTIDQLQSLIVFESDAGGAVKLWDTQINSACNSVASISDSIIRQYPKYSSMLKTA